LALGVPYSATVTSFGWFCSRK